MAIIDNELVFFELPNDQILTSLTMNVDTVDVLPVDKYAASRFKFVRAPLDECRRKITKSVIWIIPIRIRHCYGMCHDTRK